MSVTSGQGTEAGLTEFHNRSLSSLMPQWEVPWTIEQDGGGAAYARQEEEAEQRHDGPTWMLESALPIPGMLHIVSNMLIDMHWSLSYWKRVHGQCKTIEKLLKHKPHRDRHRRTCVDGTPFATQRDLLSKGVPSVYEKRWHHVIACCKALVLV